MYNIGWNKDPAFTLSKSTTKKGSFVELNQAIILGSIGFTTDL